MLNEIREYDLVMSKTGFENFSAKLKIDAISDPQVYVHVATDMGKSPRILRIGSAKNGIRSRWISAKNGHRNTFEWSTGESSKYGIENAVQYQNYLLFFSSLFEKPTKIYTLSFSKNDAGYNEMLRVENFLIDTQMPFWEWFRPKFQAIREKYNLRYLHELGAALKSVRECNCGYLDNYEIMLMMHSGKFDLDCFDEIE